MLYKTSILYALWVVLVLAGCEETFRPLQENEAYPFSIYGYLDASADTQWVRVSPARDQLDMPAGKPDMHVTLEDLQNGNKVVMNDSLFLRADGFHYLNVWTETDIEPGRTYRLKAELPDGASSSASVTIPDDYPMPHLVDLIGACRGTLRISGVDRLADLQSIWYVQILDRERVFSIPYRNRVENVTPTDYNMYINTIEERERINNQILGDLDQTDPDGEPVFRITNRELFVASGGPEWLEEIESMNDMIYALPDGISNVENGLGYMIGIVSKTIQWNSCLH